MSRKLFFKQQSTQIIRLRPVVPKIIASKGSLLLAAIPNSNGFRYSFRHPLDVTVNIVHIGIDRSTLVHHL